MIFYYICHVRLYPSVMATCSSTFWDSMCALALLSVFFFSGFVKFTCERSSLRGKKRGEKISLTKKRKQRWKFPVRKISWGKKHLHYLHNFISCLGIFKLHLENSNIEQNKKKQRLRFLGFSHYPYITLSNLITSSSTVSSPHLGVQIGSRPLLSRR